MKITRYRGNNRPFVFTITNQAGSPVDLTGYTFLFTVNKIENPGDATTQVMQFTGTLSQHPTDGVVTFSPTSLNMNLQKDIYFYDIQGTKSGVVTTFVKDQLEILQTITQAS